MNYPTIWPQFFTATIYNWNHLLKEDEYKDILIDCLKFLVDEKRVEINAFVIMSNHVHIIWQPLQHYTLTQIQTSFMTYTAKAIKKKMLQQKPDVLQTLKVNKYDRTCQVWKREPLSIELFTEKTFMQKLGYIHNNAVNAGFYLSGIDEFEIVTHYSGN